MKEKNDTSVNVVIVEMLHLAVADPDLELRGRPSFV